MIRLEIEYTHHGRTLVALSGGADSVALLRLMHAQHRDFDALHCYFHLRGEESDRDERFVRNLCQELDITLYVQHFDTIGYARSKGISIEMAARELRYEWFEEMRVKLGANYIAVAHHQEDQAETILLNLVRGTGLRGLAGMSLRSGHIIRPLLNTPKHEILQYLESIHQDYVTDSSNLERDAMRNRIRLDVMPLLREINPQASKHIAEAANRVGEALPYFIKGVDKHVGDSAFCLHERLLGLGFTPAQEAQMLESQRTGALFESPTHRATFDRGSLIVEEKHECDNEPPILKKEYYDTSNPLLWLACQTRSRNILFLDADLITLPLELRHPHEGDYFFPLGMEGRRKLVSDYLTDQHLNIFEKQRQWLLCHGKEVVWLVGLRADHRYRITDHTRRILKIAI